MFIFVYFGFSWELVGYFVVILGFGVVASVVVVGEFVVVWMLGSVIVRVVGTGTRAFGWCM